MKNKPDTRQNMKLTMKRGEVCEERAAQGYMEAQKRSLTEDRKALKERGSNNIREVTGQVYDAEMKNDCRGRSTDASEVTINHI